MRTGEIFATLRTCFLVYTEHTVDIQVLPFVFIIRNIYSRPLRLNIQVGMHSRYIQYKWKWCPFKTATSPCNNLGAQWECPEEPDGTVTMSLHNYGQDIFIKPKMERIGPAVVQVRRPQEVACPIGISRKSQQAPLLSNQISLIHGSRIKWKSLSCPQFRPYSYQILCHVGGTSPPTWHKIW